MTPEELQKLADSGTRYYKLTELLTSKITCILIKVNEIDYFIKPHQGAWIIENEDDLVFYNGEWVKEYPFPKTIVGEDGYLFYEPIDAFEALLKSLGETI